MEYWWSLCYRFLQFDAAGKLFMALKGKVINLSLWTSFSILADIYPFNNITIIVGTNLKEGVLTILNLSLSTVQGAPGFSSSTWHEVDTCCRIKFFTDYILAFADMICYALVLETMLVIRTETKIAFSWFWFLRQMNNVGNMKPNDKGWNMYFSVFLYFGWKVPPWKCYKKSNVDQEVNLFDTTLCFLRGVLAHG